MNSEKIPFRDFAKHGKSYFLSPLLLTAIVLTSCKVEPEPLVFGTDVCHACKMTLMDTKYGAELVTAKGKVFKFDDINCMVNFLNSGYLEDEAIACMLVVDYTQPGKMMNAKESFYLKSAEFRMPMASEVAAFGSEKLMREYKKKVNAIYLGWGELTTQFK